LQFTRASPPSFFLLSRPLTELSPPLFSFRLSLLRDASSLLLHLFQYDPLATQRVCFSEVGDSPQKDVLICFKEHPLPFFVDSNIKAHSLFLFRKERSPPNLAFWSFSPCKQDLLVFPWSSPFLTTTDFSLYRYKRSSLRLVWPGFPTKTLFPSIFRGQRFFGTYIPRRL